MEFQDQLNTVFVPLITVYQQLVFLFFCLMFIMLLNILQQMTWNFTLHFGY